MCDLDWVGRTKETYSYSDLCIMFLVALAKTRDQAPIQ
jgi:hypothetical protein